MAKMSNIQFTAKLKELYTIENEIEKDFELGIIDQLEYNELVMNITNQIVNLI